MEDWQSLFPIDLNAVMLAVACVIGVIASAVWLNLVRTEDGDSSGDGYTRKALRIAAVAVGSAVGAAYLGYAMVKLI
jgi:hypothetical protein